MADHAQDSLFKEIDEELRQEHYAKLWKKYGNYVIAAAVALVVSVGGYQGWRHYQLTTRQAEGERFVTAVERARTDATDGIAAFADLGRDAGGGYALLARLREAALKAENGDTAGAGAIYEQLAADSAIDDTYRDLAVILGALSTLDGPNAAAWTSRVEALNTESNPWRHSAREILAVQALQSGDRAKARDIFKSLTEDAGTPAGIRARATELLDVVE